VAAEVDTALMYMDQAGVSEAMIRRVLEDTQDVDFIR
jgi:hypothetical protein